MRKSWFVLLLTVAVLFGTVSPTMGATLGLIANGDFEEGNTGFDTEYTYLDPANTGTWTLGPPFMYTIGTNPGLYHSAWLPGFGDHTSGAGKMMIVNGTSSEAGAPNKLVWGQDVTLPASDPVTRYTLYAGKTWEIGEVLVKSEAGKICVKLVITDPDALAEGWLITEAHVAVAASVAGIPQKNGNPIPGKFPVNVKLTPGVTETEWYCLDYAWTEGVPVVIAAHAKIELPELGEMVTHHFCVTSGLNTDLASGGDAAIAWGPGDPWGDVDTSVNDIPDCPDIASYIWDAQWVTPTVADEGGMVDFVQGFDVIGTPTSATLKIAADNAFAYSLNGGAEVAENLAADWRAQAALGNFDWPGVVIDPYPSGWSRVYSYDVLGSIVSGTNALSVTAVNADWPTTDPRVNPAMVIYKLCGTSEQYVVTREHDDESGWGGEGAFPGKNWAKYITYTPEIVSDSYLLEFYAASSYPAAPAQLQVTINGEVVPPTLELTSTNGEWVKYSAAWDAGTATSARIEIRDLRFTYSGDDFCIDDISFVKQ